jgi:hypothetical protein
MWFTSQSHENMFRAVCGPWVIMNVPPKGFHHIRHCGPFAGNNRAETIHNIGHVTTSRRLRRRDSLYCAAVDCTPKNINFAPESS